MSQGGYAIVDVDDEVSQAPTCHEFASLPTLFQPGDISGHGEGLQFKSE